MIIPQSFYNRSARSVAQDLLGCFLVRRFGRFAVRAKIVETEAYCGHRDLASHASRGRTPRNAVMFGPPGFFYVYFTYGLHFMLNVVTGPEDYPAAALIRAAEIWRMPDAPACPARAGREFGSRNGYGKIPQSEFRIPQLTNGPAKLTKFLKIDKVFNGLPCFTKKYGLWVEAAKEKTVARDIARTARIGVDYAGSYKDKKWRFYLRSSEFVSKK